MDVKYTEKVMQWGEGKPLIQQATNRLEEILGSSPRRVTGEWDRTLDEKGQSLATLRLKDSDGEVVKSFSLDELQSDSLSIRLRFLWDDLLRIYGDKWLKEYYAREG